MIPETITVPWVTAKLWRAIDTEFEVSADISELIRQHGNGLYSVMVWAEVNGRNVTISEYSIFNGVTPPTTYSLPTD